MLMCQSQHIVLHMKHTESGRPKFQHQSKKHGANLAEGYGPLSLAKAADAFQEIG